MITTINPTTGKKLHSYEYMTKDQALQIVDQSAQAYASWKELSIEQRSTHLEKLADVLRTNKEKYATLMTDEMGKTITEAIAEVEKCAWLIDVLIEKSPSWLADEEVKADGIRHVITYAPLGPIYIIMPWNYPFWQVFKVAMAPLFAGNTILLKHATNVTGCALAIEDACKQAKLPQDVFRTLIINHETSSNIINAEEVVGVSLTGSVRAGKIVGEQAGKNIKKMVMELGGSDPFIVLEDADVKAAAKAAVNARTSNCGQVCIGAKRMIVHESLAEEFSKEFSVLTAHKKIGNPHEKTTDIGPLVNEKAVKDMESFVNEAVKEGATLVSGGKRSGPGFFFEPAILTNVTESMRVASEETFGPIAPIITFTDEKEAIRIANKSEYGLNASIWSKDIKRAEQIARKIEAGGIFINEFSKSHPLLPLGGIKKSGYGRELGKWGIKEFTNVKPINIYEVSK